MQRYHVSPGTDGVSRSSRFADSNSWQGFTSASKVAFNGTVTSFQIVDTFLNATVPVGATIGEVQVRTAGGTLRSNMDFRIVP